MANTVIEAFNDFMTYEVNLDSGQTKRARGSRDWLVEQIQSFPDNDSYFPQIYTEKNIFYGSFARNTKKRPLDDIDIMICMKADGCTYTEYSDKIEINVPESATRYHDYVNDDTKVLNSKKVINAFVKKLVNIPQYKKSEVKRNQEAATLNLQSYDWTFDIVPCLFTVEDIFKKTYYIIPDGSGNWKKTDPRLDKERLERIKTSHGKAILNAIRAIKYWNARPTMPSMGSYLLENMLLDYYSTKATTASEFVDIELVDIFYDIHSRVYATVNDPKKIQGNLNNLTFEEKQKISTRAYSDYVKATEARRLEEAKYHKDSINKWRDIFGDKFPEYKP